MLSRLPPVDETEAAEIAAATAAEQKNYEDKKISIYR